MKSYKLNRGLSRVQILVLALAVLVSIVLVGLGYNLRKLDQISVELQTPGLMDVLKPQAPFVAKITVNNPTMIPFTILPFSLMLKTAENVPLAHLACNIPTKIKLLSPTEIPLTIKLEKGFKLQDILAFITKGAVIEGKVTGTAFGIKRTAVIRKEYALSKLL